MRNIFLAIILSCLCLPIFAEESKVLSIPEKFKHNFLQNKIDVNTKPEAPKTKLNAADIFSKYRSSVGQIKVINETTGQKTTIGSGFVIKRPNLIATNYHVISDVVRYKNRKPVFVNENNETTELKLLDFDIVHDLAILEAQKNIAEPLITGDIPEQGEPLFSLGNPHDLGVIISNGVNNGLISQSASDLILFSGAINSGMSGGPSLDSYGQLVGVNVSIRRNSQNVSFLVPALHLNNLIDNNRKLTNADEYDLNIASQTASNNQKYFESSLNKTWEKTHIGKYSIPLAINNETRCWDVSPVPEEDDLVEIAKITCQPDRSIYVDEKTDLGELFYSFTYVNPIKKMHPYHFYSLYSTAYKMAGINVSKRSFDNDTCHAGFIKIDGQAFKTTYCKKPGKLKSEQGEALDIHRFIAASISDKQAGFIIYIQLVGIQSKVAHPFIKKLLSQITFD